MKNIKEILSNKYVLWAIIAFAIFIALVGIHFGIFRSIPISSLWRAPLTFCSFYAIRILTSLYLSYVTLVICGKVKAFSNKTTLLRFGASALMLIAQILLFLLIMSDEFSSLRDVSVYSWLAKISISILVAAVILVMRRKYWMIILEMMLGIWLFAEIVNYRAFGFFLDGLSITLIGNLNGFWGAIPQYIRWYDYSVILLPLLLLPSFSERVQQDKKRHLPDFSLACGVALLLNIFACYGLTKENLCEKCPRWDRMVYNPLSSDAVGMMCGADRKEYMDKFSVVHSFFFCVNEFIEYELSWDEVELSEDEEAIIAPLIKEQTKVTPSNRLIIVLVESLETWVVRPEIMPNLCHFMETHDNLLYANNVISERKAGSSADGQLIVNTGLLPVAVGTVAFKYCYNTFPSLSEMYDNACGIFPHGLSVWNQKQMSDAYGLDANYVVSEYDKEIFATTIAKAQTHDYVLAITLSSHAPFDIWADSSKLSMPKDMPSLMRDYIRCINFMDEGLGLLLDAVDTDSLLHQTTIAITGDHSIFNDDQLSDFRSYQSSHKENAQYDLSKHNCPLIIYSPLLPNRVEHSQPTYQMDVYPTILTLIGAKDYYWQGFGMDLSNTTATRIIDEETAFVISDKMIRMNFFRTEL